MKQLLLVALGVLFGGSTAFCAPVKEAVRDGFIVVPFLSKTEASPGEKVQVVIEIYNMTDHLVQAPDPEKLELSFDQVSTEDADDVYLLGPFYLDGPATRCTVPLERDGKLQAKKVFEVPNTTGVLLIRSIDYESARVPLRVIQKEPRPNQRPEANAGKASVSPSTPGPGVAHP
ncbi:MAG TPA: hypothetical protein PL015_12275 [Opitutaceae bacterium]|nr:hypothetical protein [Opitutaceae bacterium]